jgi:hypothetical protein
MAVVFNTSEIGIAPHFKSVYLSCQGYILSVGQLPTFCQVRILYSLRRGHTAGDDAKRGRPTHSARRAELSAILIRK